MKLDLSRVALSRRRTKIVATLGPSSATPERLDQLIAAGTNVFRLNFSHGTQPQHAQIYALVREAAQRAQQHVAVLADLCGPKIRCGVFEGGGIDLVGGSEVVVSSEGQGGPGRIVSEYAALVTDVRPGDRILLDDGKLELKVKSVSAPEVRCQVVVGGRLSNKKGINLPGVAVSAPALTEKDMSDALFAAGLGVDWLALSFVRSASDVAGLKLLLVRHGFSTPVVSKIEKPEALACIEEILEVTDAVMVARGDLGVEMPPEEVPLIQQELVRACRQRHRPVIVATQMLESMIENPRPTRAEVTDVASAAFGHTDAVMLSAETAVGRYPVEAVAMMDKVLRMVEGYSWKHRYFGKVAELAQGTRSKIPSAVSRAASLLSSDLDVRAVVVPTRTGTTARLVSSERPAAAVVAVAESAAVCRQLALCWGVTPVQATAQVLAHPAALARQIASSLEFARSGEPILMVWDAGAPGTPASEPAVSVLHV
jgi:pyruvate kinase